MAQKSGWNIWLAVVLALVVALATPGRAAEERAVKSRVAPAYPELAKRMKITGMVKVEATVDPDGKVTDVKTVEGNHTLSPAAEDAVRKWRFAPGPSSSVVFVEVNFGVAQ